MNSKEIEEYKNNLLPLIRSKNHPNIMLALQIAKGVKLLDWALMEVWGECRWVNVGRWGSEIKFFNVELRLYTKYIAVYVYHRDVEDFSNEFQGYCLFNLDLKSLKERRNAIRYMREYVFRELKWLLE